MEEGGSGSLLCQVIPAKGSTRVRLPRARWSRRDRRPLSPQVRDNGRGALSFSRVTSREEGTYICSAGDIRREAVVRIERRGGEGRGRDDRGRDDRRRGKHTLKLAILFFAGMTIYSSFYPPTKPPWLFFTLRTIMVHLAYIMALTSCSRI